MLQMDAKKKEILKRIENLESAISKANAYLESGAHANWIGFRAFFVPKTKNGKSLPPHKDWVKNVFLRNQQRALRKAEILLERLELGQR